MALVLDDTAGGTAANTYASLSTAETYFLARPFADVWNAATATDALKNQALVWATTILDREKWKGTKGSTPGNALVQAREWPRRWAPTLEYDADPQFVAEYFIDLSVAFYSSLTIPTPIVNATCELALEMFRAGATDPLTRDFTRNVKREKVGALETEYIDPWYRVYNLGFFPSVIALVAPLLRSGDGTEVIRG